MRKTLINLLEGYASTDPSQVALKMSFLQFVENNPNCLSRDCLFGHFTASAWVISETDPSLCLLLEHAKLNCWLQPGGHADGDANLINVAKKEFYEETGLSGKLLSQNIFDLDLHFIPLYKDIPPHLHFDVRFLFEANSSEEPIISNESKKIKWVNINELAEYKVDSSVIRMVMKSKK